MGTNISRGNLPGQKGLGRILTVEQIFTEVEGFVALDETMKLFR